MTYTVGSLFSGIGGLDLAAHWAGFTTSWFVEREPFCQKVLAKHWAGVPIHSDVFECHDLPHVDVIVGGFPCQPFSVAGNRKGASDERYLLPEMLRIISEVKPYVVLFENVPGFPSLSDGAEFKYLLRALAEMGFNAEWGHLRASDCGAPHQRERWFCVAYATSGGTPATQQSGQRGSVEFSGKAMADAPGFRFERYREGQEQNRLQQGWASELARGSQIELGDSTCRYASKSQTRNGRGGFNRTGANMGNTDSKRLEGQRSSRQPVMGTRHRKAQLKSTGYGAGQSRATEPRLRGTADGLPSWLDFVGWPARPGEDQHSYEPSRVTSAKTPDRAARLKALGNAVVPQVAYPLFVAIHEWLAETEADAQRSDGVA